MCRIWSSVKVRYPIRPFTLPDKRVILTQYCYHNPLSQVLKMVIKPKTYLIWQWPKWWSRFLPFVIDRLSVLCVLNSQKLVPQINNFIILLVFHFATSKPHQDPNLVWLSYDTCVEMVIKIHIVESGESTWQCSECTAGRAYSPSPPVSTIGVCVPVLICLVGSHK